MLKISEFAQLAHTTRRTLILYDHENIFRPARASAEGYRYYEYDQLYEINTILTLKKLGLSLTEIKAINADPATTTQPELIALQDKIQHQISGLQAIQQSLTQRLASDHSVTPLIHTPEIYDRPAQQFAFSERLADCSPQQIAETFSQFYNGLSPLASMDGRCSGFMLELPSHQGQDYATAPFYLIKEVSGPAHQVKPAGQYVGLDTKADSGSVAAAIDDLGAFIDTHQLSVAPKLWQINLDDDLRGTMATTSCVRLEYQLL